jgi:hypothetical protein
MSFHVGSEQRVNESLIMLALRLKPVQNILIKIVAGTAFRKELDISRRHGEHGENISAFSVSP